MVTLGTVFIANLKNSMGCYTGDCSLVQRMTLSYQHGFDEVSALVHLLVDIVLMIMIGAFTEKVLGNFRFFILTLSAMLLYMLVHFIFKMIGHGASPIIYSYAPIVYYCLNEGRLIKTRSAYDDHFRELRSVLAVLIFILPVLFSFVPINFDSNFNFFESIFYGNLFNAIGLATGFVFLSVYKKHIRNRLKTISRKKKFDADIFEKETRYLALFVFPMLALLAFLLR